jgi:quinol-cytochrome oxidoreductase complex cytochrome b subunit
VRSAKFRPVYRWLLLVWVAVVVVLGICGSNKPEGIWVILSRICTLYYFLHLLVILPLLGKIERTLPLPESISRPVLGGGGPLPAGATAKPMEKA